MNTLTFSNLSVRKLQISNDDPDEYDVTLNDKSHFALNKDDSKKALNRLFSPNLTITVDAMKNRILEIIDMNTEEIIFTDTIYRLEQSNPDFLATNRNKYAQNEHNQLRYQTMRDCIPEYRQQLRGLTELEGELSFGEMELIAWCGALLRAGSSAYYSDDVKNFKFNKILKKAYKKYKKVGKHSDAYISFESFAERVRTFHRLGY